MLLKDSDMLSTQKSGGELDGVVALENRVQVGLDEAVRCDSESYEQYLAGGCVGDWDGEKSKNESDDGSDKADKGAVFPAGQGLCTDQTGAMPVMPQHARPVRFNRGIKRRFPGDESDDSMIRKRARVRSMTEVCVRSAQYVTASTQQCQGEFQIGQAKKKGRPLKSLGGAKKQQHSRKLQSETAKTGNKRSQATNTAESLKHQCKNSSALYRHARVHGDRPFVCHYDGCNKRFLERSKLKRHFLIHTGEKSFLCLFEGCGKAFSLDFNLRSHMKTHTGEYHECPHEGCEKKYCQNYKLRAHINKEHKEGLSIKNKSAVCGIASGKSTGVVTQKSAKKQEKLKLLDFRRDKLEKWKEGRRKRIKELESERDEEAKKLVKVEKALKGMNEEREQLELFESEQLLSSVESEFGQISGEEKEVLVFAQKLPTGDQGARLVHAVKVQFSYQPQSTILQPSPQLQAIDVTVENSLAAGKHGGVLLSSKSYVPAQVSSTSSNSMQFNIQHALDPNENWTQKHEADKQEPRMALNSCCTKSKSCTSVTCSKFVSYSGQEQDYEERLYCKIQPSASDIDLDRINQHQKFLLSQQSEPPVVHLFSFQDQPCLVD
ncbi:hypothetical protein O6H91_18G031600 [Diphasiastrum complanatum]|uniref:Uncharacterized protein n=1 Tax=Diphasiastrum complanatum TaxID=34168 RepID=A0ACC2AZK3_DIPCM|nr:hypothetical protein O6H91_18G031600 [Diphasiastrum complanatum]